MNTSTSIIARTKIGAKKQLPETHASCLTLTQAAPSLMKRQLTRPRLNLLAPKLMLSTVDIIKERGNALREEFT